MSEPQIWYDPVKMEYTLHDGGQVFVVSPEMRELLLQQCRMTDTEREALCARIDELCQEVESWRMVATSRTKQYAEVNEANDALQAENAKLRDEVERLHADQAHWELGNCPSCPNVVSLQEALEQNARLRELADGAMNEADRLTHDAAALQIENAKLRMLLSSYWKAVHSPVTPNIPRDYLKEMRELGIEVES